MKGLATVVRANYHRYQLGINASGAFAIWEHQLERYTFSKQWRYQIEAKFSNSVIVVYRDSAIKMRDTAQVLLLWCQSSVHWCMEYMNTIPEISVFTTYVRCHY